jgi:hypothetical protein
MKQKEETWKPSRFWLSCTRKDNNKNSIQVHAQCNGLLKYDISNTDVMIYSNVVSVEREKSKVFHVCIMFRL